MLMMENIVDARKLKIEKNAALKNMVKYFNSTLLLQTDFIEDFLDCDVVYYSASTDNRIIGKEQVNHQLQIMAIAITDGTDAVPGVIAAVKPDANTPLHNVGDVCIIIRYIQTGEVKQLAFVEGNSDGCISSIVFENADNYDYEWCFPDNWVGFTQRPYQIITYYDKNGNIIRKERVYSNGEPVE